MKKKLKKALKKRVRKLVVKHGPEVAAALLTGFVSGLAAARKPRHPSDDSPHRHPA
ncbi:MAG TPA: hypothetical protein VFJ16_16825 [Longimicrobium sp.]|nr:hypothetical protein [Longimicrobium sp.]